MIRLNPWFPRRHEHVRHKLLLLLLRTSMCIGETVLKHRQNTILPHKAWGILGDLMGENEVPIALRTLWCFSRLRILMLVRDCHGLAETRPGCASRICTSSLVQRGMQLAGFDYKDEHKLQGASSSQRDTSILPDGSTDDMSFGEP